MSISGVLQPAGLDEGAAAGDGGQEDDRVHAQDRTHSWRAWTLRRDYRDMASPNVVLTLSVLGLRRE